MTRIDGAKVKALREQKGLTQLYVATVVEVTTDTISRWENKRYPTIKKENALKLAEALEVDFSEFVDSQEPDENRLEKPTTRAKVTVEPKFNKIWPLLLLSSVIALLIGFIAAFFISQSEPLNVSATRILPARCTPEKVFPVLIKISSDSDKQTALILKEKLPENFIIAWSTPALPKGGKKDNLLRWLGKIEKSMYFYYGGYISDSKKHAGFSGSIAADTKKAETVQITGDSKLIITEHHWADSDGDNRISDTEILSAYDRFGEVEQMRREMDFIEEMWLGSGYIWQAESKEYAILP